MSEADINAAIQAGRSLTALAQSPDNLGPNDQKIANAISAVQRLINVLPESGEKSNLKDGRKEVVDAITAQPVDPERVNSAITRLNSALGVLEKKGGRRRNRKTRRAKKTKKSKKTRSGRTSSRL